MNKFDKCLEEGKIVKFEASVEMIKKEIENAEYDLARAEESVLKGDSKWASVQAYYSMFHSAKALVFKKGYREKSHICLLIALRELYVRSREMDKDIVDQFEMCMDVRHEADYGLSHDEESARICIESAIKLLVSTKNFIF
jgi:uncharacterized protein (UPF0332 family)